MTFQTNHPQSAMSAMDQNDKLILKFFLAVVEMHVTGSKSSQMNLFWCSIPQALQTGTSFFFPDPKPDPFDSELEPVSFGLELTAGSVPETTSLDGELAL